MPNKRTTDMRPPYLRGEEKQPGVFVGAGVDPAAAAYAAGIAARQQQRAAPKYAEPVGGGPAPHIPRLDAPHQEGLPMAAQAERVNSPSQQQMVQQAARPGSIVEPPINMGQMQATRSALGGRGHDAAVQAGLQTGDMLPEEALKDPEAQHGPGSAYAVSQPHLALRYGVVRGGRRIAPQELKQGRPGQLSPGTLEGLQAIQQAQAMQQRQQSGPDGLPHSENEALEQADDGSAAQSARAADPPMTEKEKKEVEEAINAMDSFDYDGFRQRMERDILNNPRQREIIRGRCKDLNLDDLIMKNRVSQDVPIIPAGNGRLGFVVRYTSMTGEEDLALKQLIMQESKSIEVTDRYLLDKFAFMAIACGLAAINNNPAPTHLDDKGDFNAEKFWLKFNWVLKRPIHMLASIGVNHSWFEQDVRKLFVAEKLGNG